MRIRSSNSASLLLIDGNALAGVGGVMQSLAQSADDFAERVLVGAVHHPFEVLFVEFRFRLPFRFRRLGYGPIRFRLRSPVLFPTISGFLAAGFGAVALRPPMAGWLEFLAAEFALHRRNPRFPTFRCFPCFRRLNPRGEIGTAPEATGRGYTRGPRPGIGVRCRTF